MWERADTCPPPGKPKGRRRTRAARAFLPRLPCAAEAPAPASCLRRRLRSAAAHIRRPGPPVGRRRAYLPAPPPRPYVVEPRPRAPPLPRQPLGRAGCARPPQSPLLGVVPGQIALSTPAILTGARGTG